jgi:hypothetical protein
MIAAPTAPLTAPAITLGMKENSSLSAINRVIQQ